MVQRTIHICLFPSKSDRCFKPMGQCLLWNKPGATKSSQILLQHRVRFGMDRGIY